jgi:tetratricopeptide (TPR) repeat protein
VSSTGLSPLTKRLLVLTMGLVVTLVAVELGIRVAYSLFVRAQYAANLEDLAEGEGVFRIICLGESTTAVAGDADGRRLVSRTSYPTQLEGILEERRPGQRFEVFNYGSMSGTSSVAIEQLGAAIPELQPHMVIAMLGIKDTPKEELPGLAGLPPLVAELRTVQLAAWLVEEYRLEANRAVIEVETVDDIPDGMDGMVRTLRLYTREPRLMLEPPEVYEPILDRIRVGMYLWYVGRMERAEAVLRELCEETDYGYPALARVLVSAGKYAEAREVLEFASALHPDEVFYRIVLADLLTEDGYPEQAAELLQASLDEVESFRHPEMAKTYIKLGLGDALRVKGDHAQAREILEGIPDIPGWPQYKPVLMPVEMLKAFHLGHLYLDMEEYSLAEENLRFAIQRIPKRHISMFLLSQVYAATGEWEKEEAIRREILDGAERLAEYFELAKLYRREGHTDRAPELVAEAMQQIPSLERNYRELYNVTQRNGIHLVVMQYPSFSLDLLHNYAPPDPGVTFVDNEHLFDADPDRYFFSPTFPNSFSHYTAEGSKLLAGHLADTVLAVVDEAPVQPPEAGDQAD